MKYKQPVLVGVAILAVAAAFWGYGRWSLNKALQGEWPELNGGLYDAPITKDGEQYLVPGDDIYDTRLHKDGIPPLNDPRYVSVAEADVVIADDIYGIDLEVNGQHWYFPYQIMNWHEIVNGTFDGKELAVTYCPLCGSPVVYERSVNGQAVTFGTSGMVYNNTTLMYDSSSDSLWLQATGDAVKGDLVGSTLTAYPSTVMKWGDWKKLYPDSQVLSTETGYVRDYTRHPYGSYDSYAGSYFPLNYTDATLSTKWVVTWVGDDAASTSFSRDVLKGRGTQQTTLGELPLAAFYDFDLQTTRVFDARVDGQTLTFSYDWNEKEIRDAETGSVWNAEGEAISGKMRGKALTRQIANDAYWFCYIALHPNGAAVEVTPAKAEETTNE